MFTVGMAKIDVDVSFFTSFSFFFQKKLCIQKDGFPQYPYVYFTEEDMGSKKVMMGEKSKIIASKILFPGE